MPNTRYRKGKLYAADMAMYSRQIAADNSQEISRLKRNLIRALREDGKVRLLLEQEETEDDFDLLEPLAFRIVNWLLRTGWLRRVEDYSTMTVNIVIPDYAAVFVDAFGRLAGEGEDETQVYVQNVYGILFAFKNDPRSNISLLKAALVNTRRLNKTLQDMLHNMDRFLPGFWSKRRMEIFCRSI